MADLHMHVHTDGCTLQVHNFNFTALHCTASDGVAQLLFTRSTSWSLFDGIWHNTLPTDSPNRSYTV